MGGMMTMSTTFGLASELSLRQALEDGLKIVRNSELDAARKRKVLEELADFFSGAKRGSELARAQSLFVHHGDKPAFEAYSLLFSFVGTDYGPDLDDKIQSTSSTLLGLMHDAEVPEVDKGTAEETLQAFLNAVRTQSSLRPLRRPRDFGMSDVHAFR